MAVEDSDEDALTLHDSALVRGVLIGAGLICVAIGVVGLVLPVLPTTPFLLVAAACFARASPTFYRRLVRSPSFGPLILEWRRHRSIPYRAKLTAIALFVVFLGTSVILFVRPPWLQAALGLFGCIMVVWLYRIPSRDRPT
jgi:uncharacterized membrane protein YbaN (DUF454 family)